MNAFKEGWFTEIGVLNGDQFNVSLKVDRVIHEETSPFQEIRVFDRLVLIVLQTYF